MINKTKQELLARIKKIQESLSKTKDIEMKKLAGLGDEISSAFEKALSAIEAKKNVFKELRENKPKLKKWRINWLKSFWPINFRYLFSMPFIYGMIIPGVFFHLCLEIYHRVAFRLYGIPRVRARDYFVYDRHLLPYLNWFEKINCVYCSYFNNLMRFATEVAGRTERYWCPIKYARRMQKTHSQYNKFVDYLDAPNFRDKWKELRDFSDVIEEDKMKEQEKKDKECEACDFIEKKD